MQAFYKTDCLLLLLVLAKLPSSGGNWQVDHVACGTESQKIPVVIDLCIFLSLKGNGDKSV